MHDFIDQRKIARVLYLKYFNISADYVNQKHQSWVPKPARRRKRKKTKGIKNLSFNITKRQNHPPPALILFFIFTIFLISGLINNLKAQSINFIPHVVVPVVASAKGGYGSDWRSDVWIYNGDLSTDAKIELYYAPTGTGLVPGDNNSPTPNATVVVGKGKTLTLEDIVLNTLHTSGSGALFLYVKDADPDKVIVESNVYNRVDDIKQYGQQIPGIHEKKIVDPVDIDPDPVYYVPASPDPEKYRANLGIVTLDANYVSLDILSESGSMYYTAELHLPQYSHIQFNDIIKTFNLPESRGYYAKIMFNGKGITYMSHVDKKTNDGSALMGLTPSQMDTWLWLPGCARSPGAQGSQWRSSFFILNPNLKEITPPFSFIPMGEGLSGIKNSGELLYMLQNKYYDDILMNEFVIEEGVGTLTTNVTEDVRVLTWMRTYNNTPEGTYGQNIPVANWENEGNHNIRGTPLHMDPYKYKVWQDVGILTGVSHNETNRANLILQNTWGNLIEHYDLNAKITILNAEGEELGSKVYSLIPFEYKQINRFVEDILGQGATLNNGTVKVEVVDVFDNKPVPVTNPCGGEFGVYIPWCGGLDARISVVNGNVYQGTNDGRLITAQIIDYYTQPSDYWECKGDPLCEKAVSYVSQWLDQPCGNLPPEWNYYYDPDGDGNCATPWFYLSNQEIRSMIRGCDPQGSTGYVCGLQTGRSIPSYAHQMAEILKRSDPEPPWTVDEIEQILAKEITDNCNDNRNSELWHSWDPFLWQTYTVQGKPLNDIAFYLEPVGNLLNFHIISQEDMLKFYDFTKEYLVRTVAANPEWYGGNAQDGPNMDYDPIWYTYSTNDWPPPSNGPCDPYN